MASDLTNAVFAALEGLNITSSRRRNDTSRENPGESKSHDVNSNNNAGASQCRDTPVSQSRTPHQKNKAPIQSQRPHMRNDDQYRDHGSHSQVGQSTNSDRSIAGPSTFQLQAPLPPRKSFPKRNRSGFETEYPNKRTPQISQNTNPARSNADPSLLNKEVSTLPSRGFPKHNRDGRDYSNNRNDRDNSNNRNEREYSNRDERGYSNNRNNREYSNNRNNRDNSNSRNGREYSNTRDNRGNSNNRDGREYSNNRNNSEYSNNRNGREYSNELPHAENRPKNEPKTRLGFKRLEEMANKDDYTITVDLANAYNGFQYLLEQESFLKERPDWIILICKLLAKVCDCEFRENKIKVLSWICESNFIELVPEYLLSLSSDTRYHQKRIKTVNTFLKDVMVLIETLVNLFENIAKERFNDPVRKIFGYVSTIEALTDIKIDETFKANLIALTHRLKNLGSIADNVRARRDDHLDEGQPPEDFRSIALYPAPEEVLQDIKVFLRRSIVNGGYENVEHYLDVQFRLLRQDLIEPLRTGFKEMIASLSSEDKRKKRINNLRVFKKCQFIKIETKQQHKITYIICFDVDRRFNHINWEYNRWFIFGSLLFFSFDKFNSFFMGTVFNKDNKTIGDTRTISVELIGDVQFDLEDFNDEVMMAESTIFFQPYYHVMKALKQFEERNFPMARYIVYVNPVINPPAYLSNNRYLQVGNFPEFDVLNEFAWPSSDQLGLDKYQYEAYKAALTREFVIMQGPPGTGKTYLGLRIVETLLKNETIIEQLGAPILLVCYTNHALDQFLEGILKFTNSIVRVGSQTKSEIIKPYELKERSKHFMYDKGLNSAYITMRDEMREMVNTIMTHEKILDETDICGILKPEFLAPYMSPSHSNQLKSANDWVQWLLVKDTTHGIVVNEDDENDEVSKKETEQNDANIEDESEDDDEVRNQLQHEEPLISDFVIDEKMHLHLLTLGSLERQWAKEQQTCEILENRYHLYTDREYSEMRYDLDVKKNHLEEAIITVDSQFKRLKKNVKVVQKDCSKMKTNLMKMTINERWTMYWNWLSNFKAEMMTIIKDIESKNRTVAEQFSEAKQLQDIQVLLSHKILGTTTTIAAKNHLMLTALKPKIVIVEEAAEVLEAHIVTALTNHCEHLILIGDHQQLRPNPTVYELAKRYNLEVSLFERMIKNNLTYSSLGVQHRMRPEICDLITPVIYPNLQNHNSVYEYDHVKGVAKNMFFITHEVPEEFDDIGQSYKNPHEADFVLRLARYLLFQGYSPDKITILTTYSGQLIYLRMQKKQMPEIRDIRISTVDNYQGEECQIILLTLVRSNSDNKIGFLATPNRVCVALSRAKHGFYLIGNMNCLEKSSQIWPDILKQLEMHQSVGSHLELQCAVHGNKTPVAAKSDFQRVTEGGCSKLCDEPLKCGHSCKRLCHPTDRKHESYKCPEKCTKTCPIGHPCNNRCYEDCNLCRVMVTRTLLCGHTINLHCYVDASSHPCKVKVELVIDLCRHKVQVPCHIVRSNQTILCPKPCESRLKCGHACTRSCHLDDDPDHLDFKCMKPCERLNANCSEEHACKKLCHENCSVCNERVPKLLPCGHEQNVLCHLDADYVHCDRPCMKMLACNHKCPQRCIDMCGDCSEMVIKRIPDCRHEIKLKCTIIPERRHCTNPCQRILSCGHQCAKKCCDPCDEMDCLVLVKISRVQSLCGHPTMVPCKDRFKPEADLTKIALDNCPHPCEDKLLCEHKCQGNCSGCKQGRLHEMCKEKCGRVKICGHSCNVDCSALCPPCKLPCMTKCNHSHCTRPCGENCAQCKEMCPWQCQHHRCRRKCYEMCSRPRCYKPCKRELECKHPCIGFCGEPCPPKCRECHKDEVTFLLFGTEDEEDARFVLLEDCQHFFESTGLETHLRIHNQNTEQDKEIVMIACPQCKTPIVNTLRFMNMTRLVMKDIAVVKKKQNGMKRTIMQMKHDVTERLKTLNKYSSDQEEKKRFLNSSKHFSSILRNIGLQVEDTRTIKNKGKYGKSFTIVNRVTHTQMALLVYIVEIMEKVKQRVLDIKTLNIEMSCQLLYLLDDMLGYIVIIPQDKLSQQQALDLHCELMRLYALANLLELKNSFKEFKNFTNERILVQSYAHCLGEINCLDRFDTARGEAVNILMEQLNKQAEEGVPRGLTPEERRMIHLAMVKDFYPGNTQGHWFKCGNCSQMYCITECGGAMEMAKCPGCQGTIGGEEHRYVAGTRLASEMDGATRPAWPSTLH
uniref:NFX1-type zinc finger-containing protein 1 n=1 Tax=Cacopsylla melanoneura TaxID=428564 RepID=A0A8D8YH08_9HEMI